MKYNEMNKLEEDEKIEYQKKQGIRLEQIQKPYAEANPENMNLNILQKNLGNCLEIIDDEVMKGYVTKLDRLPIIELKQEVYSELKDIHFFKISELVYQEDEFSVDKLAMVFHTLSNKPCTLVLMLKSDGEKTDFYLGARPYGDNSAGTLFQMLKQSLIGFFPGSQIEEYFDDEMKKDMQELNTGCISSVTSVADYKQQQDLMTNKDFIQGLEKFVYTMQGKTYTAVLIADNLSYEELKEKKREYEQIYTQISPFANMQMNFTVSDGSSESTGKSDGKTTNLSYATTKGVSYNEVNTQSQSAGRSYTTGSTNTDTDTYTTNESESNGNTHTTGTSDGVSTTVTDTKSVNAHVGLGAGV